MPDIPRWATITLGRQDGRCLSRTVQVPHGSAQDALSETELTTKLLECLRWGGVTDADAGECLQQRCFGLASGLARGLAGTLE